MLTRLDLRGCQDVRAALPRPDPAEAGPADAVAAIIAGVRTGGDEALRAYTEQFDGVALTDVRVAPEAIAAAREQIDPTLREALVAAHESIEAFHRTQLRAPRTHRRDGIEIRAWDQPVGRAGLYVPGGRAVYPSTVLMTAVPAAVAGVEETALCVPPGPDGEVPRATLAAAAVAGVEEVYAVGGAQAIAAMAYGTESIRPVDVIVGPGNVYVALAKQQLAGVVRIPAAFAGPSEVVVVADETAPVRYAAVDVVVQAEHGPDGAAWLVTWSAAVADAVTAAVAEITAASPRRDDIGDTLAKGGYAVVVDGPAQAADVVNVVAPEHLELICADADELLPLITNAGAIFAGPLSPAAIGDYIAGPSHVLPTSGTARFSGALGVEDFTKPMHVIRVGPEGFDTVGSHVEALARAEGLEVHAEAIAMRRDG